MGRRNLNPANPPKRLEAPYAGEELSKDVKPLHYDLMLIHNEEQSDYSGFVTIKLKTETKLDQIIMNAYHELNIINGHIIEGDGSKVRLIQITTLMEKDNLISLKFAKDQLEPKVLFLNFKNVNRCTFSNERHEPEVGLESYFISTSEIQKGASEFFPCFDESNLEATFSLTLVYDDITIDNRTVTPIAASVTDIESQRKSRDNEKNLVKFHMTPKMSPHLLNFIIGHLEIIEGTCVKSETKVRILTIPGKREEARFSLEMASKAVDFLEEYLNIKCPLNLIQLVALPYKCINYEQVHSWGLVYYSERDILLDSEIFYRIPSEHELDEQWKELWVIKAIVNQWFANIAIIDRDHCRYRLGLVIFLKFLCASRLYPELHIWQRFSINISHRAFHYYNPVNSNSGPFTVEKDLYGRDCKEPLLSEEGVSVLIRMFHDQVGDEIFRKSLSDYLGNVSNPIAYEPKANWPGELNQPSANSITDYLTDWSSKDGYPWIKVECEDAKNGDLILNVIQKKFQPNGEISSQELQDWQIPLSIEKPTRDSQRLHVLMVTRSKTIIIPQMAANWVTVNRLRVGFYRTAYGPKLFSRLASAIKRDLTMQHIDPGYQICINKMERMHILEDYLALCEAGHLSTTDLLTLLSCFEHEIEYPVWKLIELSIEKLGEVMDKDKDLKSLLNTFVTSLYQSIFLRLSLPSFELKIRCYSQGKMFYAMIWKRIVRTSQELPIVLLEPFTNSLLRAQSMFLARIRNRLMEWIPYQDGMSSWRARARSENESKTMKFLISRLVGEMGLANFLLNNF